MSLATPVLFLTTKLLHPYNYCKHMAASETRRIIFNLRRRFMGTIESCLDDGLWVRCGAISACPVGSAWLRSALLGSRRRGSSRPRLIQPGPSCTSSAWLGAPLLSVAGSVRLGSFRLFLARSLACSVWARCSHPFDRKNKCCPFFYAGGWGAPTGAFLMYFTTLFAAVRNSGLCPIMVVLN